MSEIVFPHLILPTVRSYFHCLGRADAVALVQGFS